MIFKVPSNPNPNNKTQVLALIRVLIRDCLTKQNTENQYVSSFPVSAAGMQRDMALG